MVHAGPRVAVGMVLLALKAASEAREAERANPNPLTLRYVANRDSDSRRTARVFQGSPNLAAVLESISRVTVF